MRVTPAQVQKYLRNVDYPVTKTDLIDAARTEGAPDEVTKSLESVADREYETPADLMKEFSAAVGEEEEEDEEEE